MNIFNELLLVCASQGILLCTVILSLRTTHPVANRLLALFIGLESLHLLFLYAAYSFSQQLPSTQLRILFGMRVLDAPALYLYVRALTDERFHFDSSLLKHLLVLLPTAFFSTYLTYRTDWNSASALALQSNSTTVLWSLYHSVIFAGYGIYALRRLNRHLLRMEQALSSLESISLRWLRGLLIAVIAADMLNIGYDMLRFAQVLGPQPKVVFNLLTTLSIIYWLAIGGLRQKVIFTEPVRNALAALDTDLPDKNPILDKCPPPDTAPAVAQDIVIELGSGGPALAAAAPRSDRLAKSGLDPEAIDLIWRQLRELLDREQPYLDPLLDLPRLARRLNRRPQELSLVINSRSGGSFYDLINGCRVEAAKLLLTDSAAVRRKMLDIALSVGFSSQSTFYNQFKKSTGVTPTIYREQWLPATAGTVQYADSTAL
jgi:AraC-like DNA-binding protein